MDCSNNDMPIRHLVIAGGGLTGLSYYGALRESNLRGEWSLNNIRTIYGCSFGAFLSVLVALDYNWDYIDDYLIKRPWQNVFKYDIYSLFESITNKGFFTISTFETVMTPLLLGKCMEPNITLDEFYRDTQIEIHIFTTDVHTFQEIDLSYKTHPEWRIVDAIYASCAIPIIFAPLKQGDSYYYDGAFFSNYPVKECIENGANPLEILGICGLFHKTDKQTICSESTMLDCLTVLLGNIMHTMLERKYEDGPSQEYLVETTTLTLSSMYKTALDKNERSRLIEIGSDLVRAKYKEDTCTTLLTDSSLSVIDTPELNHSTL